MPPGDKMDVLELKQKRQEFLRAVYLATDGDRLTNVNMLDIGRSVGLGPQATDSTVDFLTNEGLLSYFAAGGEITITHRGVKTVEESPSFDKDLLAKHQAERLTLLRFLYDLGSQPNSYGIDIRDLNNALAGTDQEIAKTIAYLEGEGLVNFTSFGTVSLTHAGRLYIEGILANDQEALLARDAQRRMHRIIAELHNIGLGRDGAFVEKKLLAQRLGYTQEELNHYGQRLKELGFAEIHGTKIALTILGTDEIDDPENATLFSEIFPNSSYGQDPTEVHVVNVPAPIITRVGKVPDAITSTLESFQRDHPNPNKTAFLMMRFAKSPAHKEIVQAIRETLQPFGIAAVRADDIEYTSDLYYNILTYIYGCGFGIAVFERIQQDEFNPNVSFEVGYLSALEKPICLLKDQTLKALHADLVGKLYRPFDPQDPRGTIPTALERWLKDKHIIPR